MGYHIGLVRSPPRPFDWPEFAAAVTALGGEADETVREGRFSDGPTLILRVIFDAEEPWSKGADDPALALMIDLAKRLDARVRGDEGESYRSVTKSYTHPDDRAAIDADARAGAAARQKRERRRMIWNIFRLVVLAILVAQFAWRIINDL